MENTGIMTFISVISPILIAVITGIFAMESRRNHKIQKATDARAEIRARESRLSLRLMFSTVLLSDATALAVQQQKINGEMTAARAEASAAMADYERFMEELVVSEARK